MFLVGSPVKKCVVLQVNDAAVRLRLVVFVSKVQRLYTDYRTDWMGGGERGEGYHPSDLLCWLTVIWSGAPNDSLGGGPTLEVTIHLNNFYFLCFLVKCLL